MTWWEATPAIVVALAVLFVPGGLLAATAGLRGLPFFALAASGSVGVLAVSAEVASRLGLDWGALPVMITTAVLALVVLLVRVVAARAGSSGIVATPRPSMTRWQVAGLAVGAALIGGQIALAIDTPDSFSQTFDNVFHLNAVQWILDTGSASSLTLQQMTAGTGPVSFYPATWHGSVALVATISGASVPVSINALNLVAAAVVWPLGVMALAGSAFRLGRVATVGAGIVAGSFTAFPLLLLDYGVLYPNFLSYALVPSVLLAATSALAIGRDPGVRPAAGWLMLVTGALGVALTQPNGVMVVAVAMAPMFAVVAIRWWRRPPSGWGKLAGRGLVIVLVVAAGFAYYVAWSLVRPPAETTGWPTLQTDAQALGEVVMQAPYGAMSAPVLAALVLAGAWSLLRSRTQGMWIVASWALIALLFIVVSSGEDPELRDFLTGVWYNNTPRLAAALPLVAAPLAIIGLQQCVTWCRDATQTRVPGHRTRLALAAAGLTVLAVVMQNPFRAVLPSLEYVYSTTDDSRLISSDERTLIDRMADEVPEGSVVAVNPWTGGALIYALAGIDTTYHHILTGPNPDRDLIDQGLAEASAGDEVCSAVERQGVEYVVDFGTLEVHGAEHVFKGFENLDESDVVKLVDSVGEVALYEIVGC